MLHLRLASATVLVSAMACLIWLDCRSATSNEGGVWMLPAGIFFVAGTSWEFARLLNSRWPLRCKSVAIASCFIFVSSSVPLFYPWVMHKAFPSDFPIGQLGFPLIAGLLTTSYFSLMMLLDFPHDKEACLSRWAFCSLVPSYVGLGASFWIFIHQVSPTHWGLLALVGVIAVTKLGDTGAYFTGRSLGKNKLCPAISPGKTIEGAIGGILSSMLASVLWFSLLLPWLFSASAWPQQILTASLFGVCIALVGMLGDLVESAVKRVVGAKDSGSTLPGLGGIWDVTDSILPTAVAGYLGIVAQLVWIPPVPSL